MNHEAAAPDLWGVPARAQAILRERAALEARSAASDTLFRDIADAVALAELACSEHDEAVLADIAAILPALEARVRDGEIESLLPRPMEAASALVRIHPGGGGADAKDWAHTLVGTYTRWAEAHGYVVTLLDYQASDEHGQTCIDDAMLRIAGPHAYGRLLSENGVHRFVRISPYDTNGRRQTAFVGVDVTPDVDGRIEIEVKESDCDVTTMTAGGPGGQHQNKVESAVRLVHRPSGIVVVCRTERSQHQNRATAYAVLRSRLYEREEKKRAAALQDKNADKDEIGFGRQIRSYVLMPYRLVKDARTGHETTDVDAVLRGELDDFMGAFLYARARGTLALPTSADE